LTASSEFLAFLRDQFEGFGQVDARRMFGGTGLFREGVMFAIVVRDTLYLKTDAHTQTAYEAEGMEPFRYSRRGSEVSLAYHQAPTDVLEDRDRLADWASVAYNVACTARNGRPRPKKRR